MIEQNTIIRRNESLLYNQIDGEIVMMSIENSEYYGLNDIASRIWNLLDEPKNVNEIIEILINDFEVKKEVCEKDVKDFLEQMIEKKLLLYQ